MTPWSTTPGSRPGRWSRPPAWPAVADDTGLEVDALDGAPGVYSARYAGEEATYADNVAKLLGALDGVGRPRGRGSGPWPSPLWPDGREVVAEGTVEGTIALAASGEGGFGYDPVFVPDEGGGAPSPRWRPRPSTPSRTGAGRSGRRLADARG